jgi:sialate O-acetylesterase
MSKGESNSGEPDNYTCLFSKMIQYWRQTWNERTNGITDMHFPFGFVQVSFAQNHQNQFIYRLLVKTD